MNVPTILQTCIYTVEKDTMGHTIIMGTGLEKVKDNRGNITLLTTRLIEEINNALIISQKYGKKTSNVHLYLKGCTLKSFSFIMFKKLIKVLNSTFEDTLNFCYIYDISMLATITWNMLKHFVDPITRKKILLVKTTKS